MTKCELLFTLVAQRWDAMMQNTILPLGRWGLDDEKFKVILCYITR